jgi:NNP family nitrate/nitrite transporter-like MFS transporter
MWGRAFSVHELAPNLAFITAPFAVAWLAEYCSWQFMFRGHALLMLVASLVFYFVSKQKEEYGMPPDFTSIKHVMKTDGFLMMVLMFSMGVMGTLGIYNVLPIFLVDAHGMSDVDANSITGFSRVATLVAALAGGWISDRLGAFRTMGYVLLLSGMLVVVIGYGSGYLLYAAVFLQPVIAVCFFPAAFAAMSALVKASMRNLVISLVVPVAYVSGGGAVPWTIGYMADAGYFSLGISIAGVLMCASGVTVFLSKSFRK